MQSTDVILPPDPLTRYQQVHRALFARKAWYHDSSVLRHTALALVTTPGEPQTLALRLNELAEELARSTPWYSSLRNSIRFLVASMLLRRGTRVADFLEELKRAGELFREHWRLSGQTFEALAILALSGQSPDGRVTREQVARMAAIWDEMKRYHPWITQRSDWPAAALLAAAPLDPAQVAERLEALYRGLHERGFSRGDALQTASHILYFHTESARAACTRFEQLYKGFKQQGLWMYEGDYDDVALLCFAMQDPAEVVARVAEQREPIAALKPRPGKGTSFSLACGTALISLLRRSAETAHLSEAQALLRIVAILQAQQAAAAAAATAAAAAAAG